MPEQNFKVHLEKYNFKSKLKKSTHSACSYVTNKPKYYEDHNPLLPQSNAFYPGPENITNQQHSQKCFHKLCCGCFGQDICIQY